MANKPGPKAKSRETVMRENTELRKQLAAQKAATSKAQAERDKAAAHLDVVHNVCRVTGIPFDPRDPLGMQGRLVKWAQEAMAIIQREGDTKARLRTIENQKNRHIDDAAAYAAKAEVQVAELRGTIEDLQKDVDHWKHQAKLQGEGLRDERVRRQATLEALRIVSSGGREG